MVGKSISALGLLLAVLFISESARGQFGSEKQAQSRKKVRKLTRDEIDAIIKFAGEQGQPVPVVSQIKWDSWHLSCIASRFQTCVLVEDLIVDEQQDLCKLRIEDNSVNHETSPLEVWGKPGGVHITRAAAGQPISGERGWYDMTVVIGTAPKTWPASTREMYCDSNLPKIPGKIDGFLTGSFCGDGPAPSGWLITDFTYQERCRRPGGKPSGVNAIEAINFAKLPAGADITVCASEPVPDGWKDLGPTGAGCGGRSRRLRRQ